MNQSIRAVLGLSIALLIGCQTAESRRNGYFASGEKYFADGHYEEAAIQFRNALQIDKSHVPSYLALARLFQKMGDSQNAMAAFRQVLKLDDKNIEARVRIGQYLLGARPANSELYKEAQELAGEILKEDASNVEGRVLLGNAFAGLGSIDKSIHELEMALDQDPSYLQAALSLGAAHLRNHDLDKAEKTFKFAIERHPDSNVASLSLASFLSSLRRTTEAERYYKRAFDLAPEDSRGLLEFADFYLSTGKKAEAENVFKDAIAHKPQAREPRWQLANFYVKQGLPEKAISTLQDLLRANPEDHPALLSLAEIYLNQKNSAKAEETVNALLAKNKNDANAHYILGKVSRDRQQSDHALSEFDAAIRLDESLQPAYIEKADLLFLRGDLEAAQNTLSAALQRDKNNFVIRGFMAKVLALRQKPEDALQEAQKVLASLPDNEDAMVARSDALRGLGKVKEAKDGYLKLAELRPNNAVYLQRLGSAEAALGDTVAAMIHIRKAIELRPDLLAGITDLMSLRFGAKQYDAALADLDQIARLAGAPQDEIHQFRGQVHVAKGNMAAAEYEFRKTIESNPENYHAYLLIAQLNVQRNNLRQAIKEVDQLIAKNNRFAPAFFLKGYYLEVLKDIPGAIGNYRKAGELDPENPVVNNNLAWLLCENGDLEEARSLAIKAKKGMPDSPEVADTLGWIYYKTKNYTLAVDQLRSSVSNRRKPGAGHYYRLGLAYFAKGDRRSARETMRKALEQDPSFPGSEEARQILRVSE